MAGNGFNVFDYVDDFKKAGMPGEQADILAKALQSVASESAATKHDLDFAKLELQQNIEKLKAANEQGLKNLDLRIANVEEAISEIKKETGEIKKETKDQTLKIIGVLGGLIAILKFLPDFFN